MQYFGMFMSCITAVAVIGCSSGVDPCIGTWRGPSGCILFFADGTGFVYKIKGGHSRAEGVRFHWAKGTAGGVLMTVAGNSVAVRSIWKERRYRSGARRSGRCREGGAVTLPHEPNES